MGLLFNKKKKRNCLFFEPDETGADGGTKYFEFLRTYIDLGEGAD